jgi:putative endonuclease
MAVTLKILHEAKGKGCRAYGVPLSLSKVQRGGKRLCSELQEFFKQTHIGVPSNLQTRVWQHKNGEGGKFTSTYNCHYLLYYEEYNHINKAIEREKNLKNWNREWKLNLIKAENPEMIDIAANWKNKNDLLRT